MTTENIVWAVGDRIRVVALVGAVGTAAACNGGLGETTLVEPSALRPPAVYSITGTVFAAMEEGALPVEAARVEIRNGSGSFQTATDADGRYGFPGLTAGLWTIAVEKDGYRGASADVDLTDTTSLDFVLEPAE